MPGDAADAGARRGGAGQRRRAAPTWPGAHAHVRRRPGRPHPSARSAGRGRRRGGRAHARRPAETRAPARRAGSRARMRRRRGGAPCCSRGRGAGSRGPLGGKPEGVAHTKPVVFWHQHRHSSPPPAPCWACGPPSPPLGLNQDLLEGKKCFGQQALWPFPADGVMKLRFQPWQLILVTNMDAIRESVGSRLLR